MKLQGQPPSLLSAEPAPARETRTSRPPSATPPGAPCCCNSGAAAAAPDAEAGPGRPRQHSATVPVPAPLPEDLDYSGAFGLYSGQPVALGAWQLAPEGH